MALGLSYSCVCGKKFKIYLPKEEIFKHVVSSVVDWSAIDAREEAEGDVEVVRKLAEMSNCVFIDGSATDRLICPECTAEIGLQDHFRQQLVRL